MDTQEHRAGEQPGLVPLSPCAAPRTMVAFSPLRCAQKDRQVILHTHPPLVVVLLSAKTVLGTSTHKHVNLTADVEGIVMCPFCRLGAGIQGSGV